MSAQISILSVVSGTISLFQTGQHIYYTVAATMDAIQSQGTLKGDDKKTWVLAYIKSFVIALGENWDEWLTLIINFIDNAKNLFNIAKKLFH